jgi:hypothetical protein
VSRLRLRRPSPRRVLRGVLMGAGLIALGIALAVVGSRVAVGTVADYHSPERLLISADGLTLASSAGSGCGTAVLEARESRTTVTVRLRTYPNLLIAPGVCAIRSFEAHLKAPLGDRRLVDGVTHKALSGFDGRNMRRPVSLPDGYVHRYDTASFPSETVPSSSAGCVQIYTADDSYDESLWIEQDVDARWQPPDGVTEQAITVRGHPGTAIPGEIEWTENGQLFSIRSMAYAYATLSTADLVAVAESLR